MSGGDPAARGFSNWPLMTDPSICHNRSLISNKWPKRFDKGCAESMKVINQSVTPDYIPLKTGKFVTMRFDQTTGSRGAVEKPERTDLAAEVWVEGHFTILGE